MPKNIWYTIINLYYVTQIQHHNSCSWFPRHQMHPDVAHDFLNTRVAAVLHSQRDPRLTLTLDLLIWLAHTKASQHLLPVWNQTHTAEKTPGGLKGSLSKTGWVGECGLAAALVTGGMKGGAGQQITGTWEISAPLSGTGWQPHLANGWYSTNAAPQKTTGASQLKIC